MTGYNAGQETFHMHFNDAVLYPNPYMVVTPKGYTKHYYAGAERLATVIGGGGFGGMLSPIESKNQHEKNVLNAFNNQYQQPDPFYPHNKVIGSPIPTEDIEGEQRGELKYQCNPTFLDYVDVQLMPDILLNPIWVYEQLDSKTEDIFFSHSDHLGSANWITSAKW